MNSLLLHIALLISSISTNLAMSHDFVNDLFINETQKYIFSSTSSKHAISGSIKTKIEASLKSSPDQVIGHITYEFRSKQKRFYIHWIVIHEGYRKKNIGTLLMRKMLQDAYRKKVHSIEGQSLPGAIGFYKKLGATVDDTSLLISMRPQAKL